MDLNPLNFLNLNFIAVLKLKYIAIALLSFLGIYAGIALAYLAPEELRISRKYLQFIRDAVLLTIAAVLITNLFSIYIALSSIILLFPLVYLFRNRDKFDKFTHILLAAALIVSAQFDIALFATLIFIYGAIIAILFVSQFEKKDIIAKKSSFIIFEVSKRYLWYFCIMLAYSIAILIA